VDFAPGYTDATTTPKRDIKIPSVDKIKGIERKVDDDENKDRSRGMGM